METIIWIILGIWLLADIAAVIRWRSELRWLRSEYEYHRDRGYRLEDKWMGECQESLKLLRTQLELVKAFEEQMNKLKLEAGASMGPMLHLDCAMRQLYRKHEQDQATIAGLRALRTQPTTTTEEK